MNVKLSVFFIGLAAIACNTLFDSKDTASKSPIELSMDRHAGALLQADTTVNAISIGVIKNGETFIGHYGELDRGKGNKPTNETIYEIASVSKTFAGTLIAQAELEGKLKLDEDIREYLNEDFPNLEYQGHPVRIRDLITHTSGLPRSLPARITSLLENPTDSIAFQIHEIESAYSKKSFFADLHAIVLDAIPGTTFSYSNADTELIAHILENIYDKPYNSIIQEKISGKLGLKHTGTILQAGTEKLLANGYTTNGVLAPHMTSTLWNAGGGMTSTLPDLLKYMEFQLNQSDPVASRSHQVVFDNAGDRVAYYWPVRQDEENGTYYSHHGGAFGMQNYLFIFPERNLGISIIINQSIADSAGKLLRMAGGILENLNQ